MLMTPKVKWLLTVLVVIAIGALAVLLVKAPETSLPDGETHRSTETASPTDL